MFIENESYCKFRKDACIALNEMITEFTKYQDIALKVLHEVDQVCRKNSIDYYLAYGSLLGAVRDKGLIPWDYDIDIWIRGIDINRLIEALKRDLPEDYYFVCRYYSKKDRHYIMRIGMKGISTEILHVDIFWLWEAGNDLNYLKKTNAKLDKYRNVLMWKLIDVRYLSLGESNIIKKICILKQKLFKILPIWLLDKLYISKVRCLNKPGDLLDDEYKTFPSEWFKSKEEIFLNDGNKYFIPSGAEKILISEYGNYSAYLPINSRFDEMMIALKRIQAGREISPN